MAIILNIETATTNCSVSLAKQGELCNLTEHNSTGYSHSEKLHVFIEQTVKDASINFSDIDAIAVSAGPGSYTGLRIGVSAAKGLCFSLGIPLIAIATLESIAHQKVVEEGCIIPLLDARRMEVYSAVFDVSHKQIRKTDAEIITESSFRKFADKGKVHLLGSGAAKCVGVLNHPNFEFDPSAVPSAAQMASLSFQKFLKQDFEDVAYFEPHYLKDFISNVKK